MGLDRGTARYALANFTLFGIYGILAPYLQLLVRGLGYGPSAVGLFLALFEVVGIVGPLALTLRAESSRRPGAIAAGSRTLAAMALCVLASLPGLVLLRSPVATAAFLGLLALGSRTMVPLLDAEVFSFVSARGGRTDYGSLRAVGTLGAIATALGLQLLPGFEASPPGLIASCIGATTLAFLVVSLGLPKGEGGSKEAAAQPRARGRQHFSPAFFLGLAIIALGRLAQAPVGSFLSLYAKEELGFDAVGWLWAIAGAAEIPLMIVAGRIIARIGPMGAIAISAAATIVRLAAYAAFPSLPGVMAAQLLNSLCYGLFQPAAVTFVANHAPPERRATAMAAYVGLGLGLPAVIGSALGGFVIELWGYRTLFLSFTAFAALALALTAITRRRFAGRAPAPPGRGPRP